MQNRKFSTIYVLILSVWGNYALGLGITQTSASSTLSQRTQPTFSAPIPTLTPFPTGAATTNSACSWVSQELSFCNFVSPGFSTASHTDQKSCLCDRSTTVGQFTGAVFDEEVSLCADYAFTSQFSDYYKLTSLESFCSSGSQSTGAPSPSTAISTSPTTFVSTPPTSAASPPTATQPPSGSSPGIQNFTPGEIAGISVGCGAAAFLAGFGLYVGIRKKKVPHNTDSGQGVRDSIPQQKLAMAEAT